MSGAERDPESTYPFAFGALLDLPEGVHIRMGWRDTAGNVHWVTADDTHLHVPPKPAPPPEQPKPVPVPKPKRKG